MNDDVQMTDKQKENEKRYQAEDDLRTMQRMDEMSKDPDRVKMAKEMLAKQAEMMTMLDHMFPDMKKSDMKKIEK